EWVTATDLRISLDRFNTFGDEIFQDTHVLQSYWYAIADVAVGARCKCNGHAAKCDTKCRCEHNTEGSECERCLDYYNDAPWGRASHTNVHECKACNCNGFSQKCYFDKDLYERTGHGGHCIGCTHNRDGANCERCKENYFQGSQGNCSACNCNPTGSRSLQCNAEGKCQCKPGVTGDKCDMCAPNHYEFTNQGCKPCGCNDSGSFANTPQCNPESGVCVCKKNVEGKQCRECKPGFFNLDIGNEFGCTPCFCFGHSSQCSPAPKYQAHEIRCKTCDCNIEGSYNATCDPVTGQCYCKPGIDGIHCDRCQQKHYGFSVEGCKDCDCDVWGSVHYQCGMDGQCTCLDNVEGRRCDRCMENKKRRTDRLGCEECPPCYSLVQDAVNQHRKELKELDDILSKISKAPTVVENADFENELQRVKAEIERLAEEAQAELGSGPGTNITNNLADLADRLADVRNMLFKIEDESYEGNESVERSKGNVSKAEDTIEAAQKEINSALEYLDGEGAAALTKARNRSDQFGKQSVDMSALAKESRLLAEKLENDAKNIKDVADKALNTSLTANTIAKDGITKQANISNEVQILANELNAAAGKLSSLSELADQALKRAKTVYDEALGLYAEVNTTLLPDIKLNELHTSAVEMNRTIDEKTAELDQLMSDTEETLQSLEDEISRGKDLLKQGHERQDKLYDLLGQLDELRAQAQKDVELTNATLKEADDIYKTLKEFSDQVTESRQLAEQAALDVPGVQKKVAAADASITSIADELTAASDKA
ncbi:jg25249, partial [Pararge aegeria aegeria]